MGCTDGDGDCVTAASMLLRTKSGGGRRCCGGAWRDGTGGLCDVLGGLWAPIAGALCPLVRNALGLGRLVQHGGPKDRAAARGTPS